MEYRLLGRSGLKVSVIGLGGWLTYGGHVEKRWFLRAALSPLVFGLGIIVTDAY